MESPRATPVYRHLVPWDIPTIARLLHYRNNMMNVNVSHPSAKFINELSTSD